MRTRRFAQARAPAGEECLCGARISGHATPRTFRFCPVSVGRMPPRGSFGDAGGVVCPPLPLEPVENARAFRVVSSLGRASWGCGWTGPGMPPANGAPVPEGVVSGRWRSWDISVPSRAPAACRACSFAWAIGCPCPLVSKGRSAGAQNGAPVPGVEPCILRQVVYYYDRTTDD